jgi:hypothetical protein
VNSRYSFRECRSIAVVGVVSGEYAIGSRIAPRSRSLPRASVCVCVRVRLGVRWRAYACVCVRMRVGARTGAGVGARALVMLM